MRKMRTATRHCMARPRAATSKLFGCFWTKAQIRTRKTSMGGTPLMWAAVFGHDDAARLLLSRGADASLKDNDGITAARMGRAQQARKSGRRF